MHPLNPSAHGQNLTGPYDPILGPEIEKITQWEQERADLQQEIQVREEGIAQKKLRVEQLEQQERQLSEQIARLVQEKELREASMAHDKRHMGQLVQEEHQLLKTHQVLMRQYQQVQQLVQEMQELEDELKQHLVQMTQQVLEQQVNSKKDKS